MKQEKCPWCLGFEAYTLYHDTEWGVPCTDDNTLFEFLVLESAQAGLSWATILKRREEYRKSFADFDPNVVALFNEQMISSLFNNKNIIRNHLKIESAIHNAKEFIKIQNEYGSFAKFLWGYVDGRQIQNHWYKMSEVPANTVLSDNLSKDLKKRGFKFVGSTIIYSYLQAMGLINDHLVSCHRYKEIHAQFKDRKII